MAGMWLEEFVPVMVIRHVITRTVTEARRVVAAFAAMPGRGAVSLDGKMLDIPHLKRAQRLLSRWQKWNQGGWLLPLAEPPRADFLQTWSEKTDRFLRDHP